MLALEWSAVDLKNKKISIIQALKRTSQGIELGEREPLGNLFPGGSPNMIFAYAVISGLV